MFKKNQIICNLTIQRDHKSPAKLVEPSIKRWWQRSVVLWSGILKEMPKMKTRNYKTNIKGSVKSKRLVDENLNYAALLAEFLEAKV